LTETGLCAQVAIKLMDVQQVRVTVQSRVLLSRPRVLVFARGTAWLLVGRPTHRGICLRRRCTPPQVALMKNYVVRDVTEHAKCGAHPNVIQYFTCFATDKHLGVVTQYAAGGDLMSVINARCECKLSWALVLWPCVTRKIGCY